MFTGSLVHVFTEFTAATRSSLTHRSDPAPESASGRIAATSLPMSADLIAFQDARQPARSRSSSTVAMIASAIMSQRTMPPKMLIEARPEPMDRQESA